jgi:repressor LexA
MNRQGLSPKELKALRHIRNKIVHGQEPPSVRDLQELLGYNSPNSAAYIISCLSERGYVRRGVNGRLQLLREEREGPDDATTVPVPLVGSAPCGAPLLAEQNIEAMIPVSLGLARPSHRYFLLRAHGDSMNLAGIQNGDLVLVRQQPSAENGDRVVALINDEATIKVFRRTRETVALVPSSKNKIHKPIYLTTDFQIQGVVTATLPDWDKG